MSDNRCKSDCRSRGFEFDPGLVTYFRGDWSWNNFYSHSPPFRWIIQKWLLSVTSESMCTKYWLTACLSLPRKKSEIRWTDRPAMTIAVDLGHKATKQTNQHLEWWSFETISNTYIEYLKKYLSYMDISSIAHLSPPKSFVYEWRNVLLCLEKIFM